MRYEMLETIHAYARERLRETAEVAIIHGRHLAYYTHFVEQAEPHLIGPQQVEWLDQAEREHDNIRAALRRSLGSADETQCLLGIRLAGALEFFWYRRNYAREAARWIEQALAVMPQTTPLAVQARLYLSAGTVVWLHGEPDRAGELHKKALAAYRMIDDLAGAAVALDYLAVQVHMQGQLDQAIALSEESAGLARQAGYTWALASILGNLGWHYLDLHDPARAEPPLREAVELCRAVGDDNFLVVFLNNLAVAVQENGRPEEASVLAAEALRAAQRLGEVRSLSLSWQAQGRVWQQQGQWAQAIIAYRESLVLLARTADKANVIETMEGLAVALVEQGQTALGIMLLAVTITQREALHFLSAPPPHQARQQEAILTGVPAEMGEAAFAAAWKRGQTMTLEQAITLALESD